MTSRHIPRFYPQRFSVLLPHGQEYQMTWSVSRVWSVIGLVSSSVHWHLGGYGIRRKKALLRWWCQTHEQEEGSWPKIQSVWLGHWTEVIWRLFCLGDHWAVRRFYPTGDHRWFRIHQCNLKDRSVKLRFITGHQMRSEMYHSSGYASKTIRSE